MNNLNANKDGYVFKEMIQHLNINYNTEGIKFRMHT